MKKLQNNWNLFICDAEKIEQVDCEAAKERMNQVVKNDRRKKMYGGNIRGVLITDSFEVDEDLQIEHTVDEDAKYWLDKYGYLWIRAARDDVSVSEKDFQQDIFNHIRSKKNLLKIDINYENIWNYRSRLLTLHRKTLYHDNNRYNWSSLCNFSNERTPVVRTDCLRSLNLLIDMLDRKKLKTHSKIRGVFFVNPKDFSSPNDYIVLSESRMEGEVYRDKWGYIWIPATATELEISTHIDKVMQTFSLDEEDEVWASDQLPKRPEYRILEETF